MAEGFPFVFAKYFSIRFVFPFVLYIYYCVVLSSGYALSSWLFTPGALFLDSETSLIPAATPVPRVLLRESLPGSSADIEEKLSHEEPISWSLGRWKTIIRRQWDLKRSFPSDLMFFFRNAGELRSADDGCYLSFP